MKIAINGFGRIGRLAFRNLMEDDQLELVAINDLTKVDMLVHLLKYDSAQGRYPGSVEQSGETEIRVDGQSIRVFAEKDPSNLPWRSLGIDVVLESTGVFRTPALLQKHLDAGAGKVVLSAPAKGQGVKTVVLGINDQELSAGDRMISNASCTTNCLAPMAKIIHEQFGIANGYISTVHAYTADQRLQDAPHNKDFRRARAAAASIIPTSTGAAEAVGLVLPELKGRLDGIAMRVPVLTGSITDCTFALEQTATVEDVNAAMRKAAEGAMKGVLEYTEDPLVSADIVGNPHSCIFDAQLTSVNGSLLKMAGWYDNEAGYAARSSDLIRKIGSLS